MSDIAPTGDNPTPPVVPPTPAPTPPAEPPKAPEPKTFTQDEVNAFIGQRLSEVERKTKQQIAESLGVSLEEAAERIKRAKEAEDAEKTELDKLREANEKLKSDSEASVSAAQQADHDKAVKLQLLLAGLPLPEDKDQKAAKLDRFARLVTVPVGASVEEIEADIDKLKSEFAEGFTAPETQQPQGNPASNPSGTPRKPALGTTSREDAVRERTERANARRGVVKPTA